jgi:hypothetical protein
MTNFNVRINLPSGKFINVQELTNKNFLILLKFCENNDLRGLDQCFNELFDQTYVTLNIIDKFYTLLAYRMLFVDPEITFKFDSSQININIADILHKIDQTSRDYLRTYVVEGIHIELDLPNIIYFTDIDDLFTGVIKTIKLNNTSVNFSELTESAKLDILAQLPTTYFNTIKSYIDTISTQLQSFIIVEGNSDFNVSEVKINIISNGFLNFIRGIYSTGLQNFLELLYYSSSKLNISSDTFFNLTPLDTRVLFNIYNRDIDAQNKEMQALKNAYPE